MHVSYMQRSCTLWIHTYYIHYIHIIYMFSGWSSLYLGLSRKATSIIQFIEHQVLKRKVLKCCVLQAEVRESAECMLWQQVWTMITCWLWNTNMYCGRCCPAFLGGDNCYCACYQCGFNSNWIHHWHPPPPKKKRKFLTVSTVYNDLFIYFLVFFVLFCQVDMNSLCHLWLQLIHFLF